MALIGAVLAPKAARALPSAGFQNRRVLSLPALASHCPLALSSAAVTGPVWPVNLKSSLPSAEFQIWTIPSLPAPVRILPSELTAKPRAASPRANSRIGLVEGKSHSLTVLSELPEAIERPSGLTAMDRTRF